MPGPREILFPVDFSERCEWTAPVVAEWVRHFRARLTLIHAIAIPAQPGAEYSEDLHKALREELEARARESFGKLVARNFVGLDVRSSIEEGDPAGIIVSHAHRSKTDLIIMPTHGYGPFRRFLIGSVTGKVLHDASCAVWTGAHTPAQKEKGVCRRILCAVDRHSSAVPLVRYAVRLARDWDASLEFVHVLPAVDEHSRNRGEIQVRRYWLSRARRELASILREAGLSGQVLMRGGALADALADTARSEKADLLVIGRGHLRKHLGRLRTHSLAIVAKSPCPVISV